VLERQRTPIVAEFPKGLEDSARRELARKIVAGATTHPDQQRLSKVVQRLDDYWRRSGGILTAASAGSVEEVVLAQLQQISCWQDFIDTSIHLRVEDILSAEQRAALDSLPTTAKIRGTRVPITYEIDGNVPVVRMRLREALARRVLDRDLPTVDRPWRFTVIRGKREVAHAASVEELQQRLKRLPAERPGRRRQRRR